MRSRLLALYALSGLGVVVACAPDALTEQTGATSHAIVDGKPSGVDEDAVVFIDDSKAQASCTGTLIASNLVLTARHCVSELKDEGECGGVESNSPASAISVQVGVKADGQDPDSVAKKIFYPAGDKDIDCGNDIAIIQLEKEITKVKPRALHFAKPTVGDTVSASGYGLDATNEPTPGRYRRSGMKVLALGGTDFEFTKKDGKTETVSPPPGTILTSEGACEGDSGGPLFDDSGAVLGTVAGPGLDQDSCVDTPDIYTGLTQHEEAIRAVFKTVGATMPAMPTTPDMPDMPEADAGHGHHDGGHHHDGGGGGDGGHHHGDGGWDGGHHHDGGHHYDDGDDDDMSADPSAAPTAKSPNLGDPAKDGDDDDAEDESEDPKPSVRAETKGCSASPSSGSSSGGSGAALAAAIGLALVGARRRRR